MKKVFNNYLLVLLLVSIGLLINFDFTHRFMAIFGFNYAILDFLLRNEGIR